MARRVRLGIIGTGIAARDLHWPALRELPDRFEIVALCNRTRARAEELARLAGGNPRITGDYRELLSWPEVEAVDIALPIAMNAPVAIDALQAGKHVFLEKPIAGDLAGGTQVVAAAAAHPGLVLLVAENIRYERHFVEGHRLIREGRIGRPVMIHADVLAPLNSASAYAATAWRITPEHLGGYLSDGGVHQVAGLQMLGGRIDAVQGMIAAFRPEEDPSDTLLANLHFESGAVGHLTYSVGVPTGEPPVVRVFGTEGTLAVHGDYLELSTRTGDERIDLTAAPDSFLLEWADFYDAVVHGTPPAVSPQDGLDDLAVIDAAFRSFETGMTVHLPAPGAAG